jgi:hypothetical protein
MSVRLRIDRIVLDGYEFGPRERALFESTMSGELTRLLTEAPVGAGGSIAVPAAAASPVEANGADPAGLGVAVARSVHAGLPR